MIDNLKKRKLLPWIISVLFFFLFSLFIRAAAFRDTLPSAWFGTAIILFVPFISN